MNNLNKNINVTKDNMDIVIDELLERKEMENSSKIKCSEVSYGCKNQSDSDSCGMHDIGPN